MTRIESVRELALSLPRGYEVLIRDHRVKFRVGRIVYLAFSRDEQTLGCAFPKEGAALVCQVVGRVIVPRR
jgi:hypothetical protein